MLGLKAYTFKENLIYSEAILPCIDKEMESQATIQMLPKRREKYSYLAVLSFTVHHISVVLQLLVKTFHPVFPIKLLSLYICC